MELDVCEVFYENPVLVATVTALGDGGPHSNRGHLCSIEKPTIDSKSESIVATPAVFIRGGDKAANGEFQ